MRFDEKINFGINITETGELSGVGCLFVIVHDCLNKLFESICLLEYNVSEYILKVYEKIYSKYIW